MWERDLAWREGARQARAAVAEGGRERVDERLADVRARDPRAHLLDLDEPLVDVLARAEAQEAKNWPNVALQAKFHRGILRGLRSIADTP